MATFYNNAGRKITLTTELGKGGEGSVYAVAGDPNIVGKIYHQPVSAEKAEKLRWMANHQSTSLLKVAAWTTETLHDRADGGKTVGFLMPAVKAKEIHELYSPKSRRTHFPEADWRFLIHTAKNIASAFNTVHEAGHVIGDVNHGNCAVLPDGTVKLIDCDSYSIRANGKNYPCEVGVATHIPPELQGQSLREVVRRQQHDNFGLAVIIFQLLFLGRHPFSGRPLGKDEKSLDDCIREYRFAYGAGAASRQIQPPPGVPSLETVSEPVANLFERAFLTADNRPTPREWVDGLELLSSSLVACRENSGHHYLKTLSSCPWCEVEKLTGNAVFPVNYRAQGQTSGFNVITIEQLLASIQMPQNLPALPVKQALSLPPPAPALVNHKKRSAVVFAALITAEIAFLIVAVIFMGFAGALVGGLVFAFVAHRVTDRTDPKIKRETIAKLNEARQSWGKLESEWKHRESNQNLLDAAAGIRRKIGEYKNLPQLRLQKLKQLDEQLYERQLEDYLDGFRIDEADIKGIGWNRAVTLQSYGIETAADIDSRRIMSISGFGPAYTQKLVVWRDGLKSRFKFDPRKGVSRNDKQKVENEIITVRRQLESTLQSGVAQLRVMAANVNGKNQYLTTRANDLTKVLAQAESDRNAVGNFSSGVATMFVLAAGIPIGGGIVKLALAPPAPQIATVNLNAVSTPAVPLSQANENSSSSINLGSSPASNGNLANTNINGNQNTAAPEIPDIDINSLTEIERQGKAEEYYNQGIEFTKANNYGKALKFYREAVKFDETKANYYHELGYALYRLKKYRDSVVALQKAASLGSANADTRELLGLNYLELKKWSEAQKIFGEITRGNYNSFSAYYNLGVAAKNAGDLSAAATALQRASQIKPNDAKAHFELGRCYLKLGQTLDANQEYQILLTQNQKLAEQLRREIDNSY